MYIFLPVYKVQSNKKNNFYIKIENYYLILCYKTMLYNRDACSRERNCRFFKKFE
jgi:hypothetical protein